MTGRALISLGALMVGMACASAPKRTAAVPPSDVVVLLAGPEDQPLGRVVVTSPAGAVDLDAERQATRIRQNEAPSTPAVLSPDQVAQLFGEALASAPPQPRQYTLYFRTGTSQLTPESQAQLPEIIAFVRSLPTSDVTVIGHTDTTDDPKANFTLGLTRATEIRDQLVAAGLTIAAISTTSHGESDPLVKTADNVAEAKNRRVEVIVR